MIFLLIGAAHSESTKSNYEGGQARFFRWLQEQEDFQSFLMPGVDVASATIEDVAVPLSNDLLRRRFLVHVTYKDKSSLNLMSYSTVAGAISSLTNMHVQRGMTVPTEIQIMLNI